MMRLKIFLLFMGALQVGALYANSGGPIRLGANLRSHVKLPFIPHRGPGKFDNALALNVAYEPIRLFRKPIEEKVGRPLKFFTGWSEKGEAHVTVISPLEYSEVLSPFLSMDEIDAIARREKIQSSDLIVLGMGSGKLTLENQLEETFFVVVDSLRLRRIRHEIYSAYLKKGGPAQAWDPAWWFPHVTIGYTKRDLHEADGVIKNLKHSWDPRVSSLISPVQSPASKHNASQ